MSGLPEVTVAGTLVADPEVRAIQSSGDFVANFTVAANSRRFDRNSQEWVDGDATFLRCSLFRQAAENVAESLHKGDRVLVIGVLKQRSWENDQGDKRTVLELAVNEIGPSLRWATATVTKVKRPATATNASTADPWASTPVPAGAGGGFSDEPPF